MNENRCRIGCRVSAPDASRYDVLYLGGGNAADVGVDDLPDNVRIASNDAGITGGIRLWDEKVWQAVRNN